MTVTASLSEKLKLATNLESGLKKVKDDPELSKLSTELCEVFSDIIITDCTTALQKDIPGRLWYSCFYKRIQELRNRVVKEKTRLKKHKSSQDKGKIEGDFERRIQVVEKNFSSFIKEILMLYAYLIDQLEGMLMPPTTQTQMTQSHSQGSSPNQKQKKTLPMKKGIIPTIHKLLIHQGDLYRYSGNFSESENVYLKAASLAPGKGNPYNQLGVVAQLREIGPSGHPLPVVALYWYCRSLAATNGAFETSQGNILRLFEANDKWVAQNSENFKGGLIHLLEDLDKQDGKQLKADASRIVLCRFVTLHGLLYRGKEWCGLMKELTKQLAEILDLNQLGDPLLVKMVTINGFSVWRYFEGITQDAEEEKCDIGAYIFMIRFGNILVKNLKVALMKLIDKLNTGHHSTNIRLLGPLLLTCEFLSNSHHREKTQQLNIEDHVVDISEFWSGIASIVTIITTSQHLSRLCECNEGSHHPPEDFIQLSKGFLPFAFLGDTKSSLSQCDAYISVDDALDKLGLSITQTQSQTSNRSRKSQSSEKAHVHYETELKLKLMRFNQVVFKCIENGDLAQDGSTVRATTFNINCEDTGIRKSGTSALRMSTHSSPFDNKSDIEGSHYFRRKQNCKDLLVYKESGEGKPALLVPNTMLFESLDNVTDNNDSTLLKLSAINDVNDSAIGLIKPSSLSLQSQSTESQLLNTVMGVGNKPNYLLNDLGVQHLTLTGQNQNEAVPLRPPPGFQSTEIALPTKSSKNSFPPTDPLPWESNWNKGKIPVFYTDQAVPQSSPLKMNNSSTRHAVIRKDSSFEALLQTRNPFSSLDYENKGKQTSRLIRSYGINSFSSGDICFGDMSSLEGFKIPEVTELDPYNQHARGITFNQSTNSEASQFSHTRNPFAHK